MRFHAFGLITALAACDRRPPPPRDARATRATTATPLPASTAPAGAPGPAAAPAPAAAVAAPAAAAPDAPCPPPPACDAPPPPVARAPWRHRVASALTTRLGAPRHRGRDLILREGEPQWAIGKFAYGPTDDDLSDEDVDLFVLRDCARWEPLGTARTTDDGAPPHPPVEGVDDRGGRVYFQLPAERALGVGRHRVRFVVRGDGSSAEALIEVLPAGARVAVTDVDGTLTESEFAEVGAVLGGADPAANPGAPEALWALARRGYRVLYLTARPEWLAADTHRWLRLRGFPPGLVHTTLGLTGAVGDAAAAFKRAELASLAARLGRPPDVAIGNQPSDVAAFAAAGVAPERAFFYRLVGDLRGGQAVDDYRALVPRLEALPRQCR